MDEVRDIKEIRILYPLDSRLGIGEYHENHRIRTMALEQKVEHLTKSLEYVQLRLEELEERTRE